MKISKSEFKPKALHYFRVVAQTGRELVISDRGKPVVKIIPYNDSSEDRLHSLRNTVKKYLDPMQPVGVEDWEVFK